MVMDNTLVERKESRDPLRDLWRNIKDFREAMVVTAELS